MGGLGWDGRGWEGKEQLEECAVLCWKGRSGRAGEVLGEAEFRGCRGMR